MKRLGVPRWVDLALIPAVNLLAALVIAGLVVVLVGLILVLAGLLTALQQGGRS